MQDDWRVSSKFTLNYGLRIEHESGMREVDNNFTVGFDPAAANTLSAVTIPADPIAGTPARPIAGGLMFAGVDGNGNTGQSPARQVVAARWHGLFAQPRRLIRAAATGLLGALELSGAEQRQQQLRSGRVHPEHCRPADRREPERQPDESVPERPRCAARQLDRDP